MKKFDLITRPYEDIYELMNQFFDKGTPLSKVFTGIKIDVQDKESEYIVEADLPGVDKENVHLDLVDNNLVIEIEQKQENNQEENNYVRKERSYSSMRRSIYLANAQKESIEAKLENGVLTVKVPKQPKDQQRKGIEIK